MEISPLILLGIAIVVIIVVLSLMTPSDVTPLPPPVEPFPSDYFYSFLNPNAGFDAGFEIIQTPRSDGQPVGEMYQAVPRHFRYAWLPNVIPSPAWINAVPVAVNANTTPRQFERYEYAIDVDDRDGGHGYAFNVTLYGGERYLIKATLRNDATYEGQPARDGLSVLARVRRTDAELYTYLNTHSLAVGNGEYVFLITPSVTAEYALTVAVNAVYGVFDGSVTFKSLGVIRVPSDFGNAPYVV